MAERLVISRMKLVLKSYTETLYFCVTVICDKWWPNTHW